MRYPGSKHILVRLSCSIISLFVLSALFCSDKLSFSQNVEIYGHFVLQFLLISNPLLFISFSNKGPIIALDSNGWICCLVAWRAIALAKGQSKIKTSQ